MPENREYDNVPMHMLARQQNSFDNTAAPNDQMKIELKNKSLILIDVKETLLGLLRKLDTIQDDSRPNAYLKYLFEEKNKDKNKDWKYGFVIILLIVIFILNASFLLMLFK